MKVLSVSFSFLFLIFFYIFKTELGGRREKSDDDEAVYEAELKAEAAGLSLSEYLSKREAEELSASSKSSKRKSEEEQGGSKKRRMTAAELEAAEEKELAKLMLSKKDRRLYEQIQFSRKKKADEVWISFFFFFRIF